MTKIVLAAFALLTLGTLFVLAETVRNPLVRVIRAILLGIVTIVGLLGLGVGITALEDGSTAVALVGGAIALLALRFGWGLSRGPRQRRHWEIAPPPDHIPLIKAKPCRHGIGSKPGSTGLCAQAGPPRSRGDRRVRGRAQLAVTDP
jgi:amino acid transporter